MTSSTRSQRLGAIPTALSPARQQRIPLEIDTLHYECQTGRSPRGRGSWAFCPFHKRNANDYLDFTVFSPSMTFTEAKRWLKTKIVELRLQANYEGPYMSEVWTALS